MKKTSRAEPPDRFSVKVNYNNVKRIVSADWIKRICNTIFDIEKESPRGDVSIVLVSDDYISKLNKKFLNRDMPTDVLAFPMNEDEVWGEVYVSVDRAIEQSEYYEVNVNMELTRLVIHGILHLLGYDDNQTESKINMHKREDFYIKKLNIN
ncbi:MAG: rRNA maturation RNase YbeY [bacterium]